MMSQTYLLSELNLKEETENELRRRNVRRIGWNHHGDCGNAIPSEFNKLIEVELSMALSEKEWAIYG